MIKVFVYRGVSGIYLENIKSVIFVVVDLVVDGIEIDV